MRKLLLTALFLFPSVVFGAMKTNNNMTVQSGASSVSSVTIRSGQDFGISFQNAPRIHFQDAAGNLKGIVSADEVTFNSNGSGGVLDYVGNINFADSTFQTTAYPGSGDNLGDHVSTKTITAGYGISGTTASFSAAVNVGSFTSLGSITSTTTAIFKGVTVTTLTATSSITALNYFGNASFMTGLPVVKNPCGSDGFIQFYNAGNFGCLDGFEFDTGNSYLGVSYGGNSPDSQGMFDDVGGATGLLTRLNYPSGGYNYGLHTSGHAHIGGRVQSKLWVGTYDPADTSAAFGVTNMTANTEERIAFFESARDDQRIEFTLANSASGWTNNFMSIMNHGSAYAADYYTDNDAGTSLFLLQGSNALKLSFATYDSQPINFWVGPGNKVGEFDSSGFKAPNITNSSLTSGRVVLSGASGIEVDDADLTFSGDTLTTTKIASSSGTVTSFTAQSGTFSVVSIGTATIGALTSGSLKGYTLQGVSISALSPADALTYYFGNYPFTAPSTTADNVRLYIPKSGTLKGASITSRVSTTLGSGESASFSVRINNTTDVLISNAAVFTGTWNFTNNQSLNTDVVAGDYIEFKMEMPTWATNPTSVTFNASVYIE